MSRVIGAAEAAEILNRAENVLIMTHVRPDGDAIGSAFGLKHFLLEKGKKADVFLPDALPDYAPEFLTEYKTERIAAEIEAYDLLVFTDSANPARVACGSLDIAELSARKSLCIDHHANNSVESTFKWVDPHAAAASMMIAEMVGDEPVSSETATFLLLGMTTDSGCFRFSNTGSPLLHYASQMMKCGVEWNRIINALYFSKPRNQQLFEADFIQNHIKLDADGKLAYAVIPQALFDKYGFDMRNGETLIDLLREIQGTVISFHCIQKGNDVKFSFRSKDFRYPVLPVAEKFGGGGHQMAAGLTMCNTDQESACSIVKDTLIRYLNGESWE